MKIKMVVLLSVLICVKSLQSAVVLYWQIMVVCISQWFFKGIAILDCPSEDLCVSLSLPFLSIMVGIWLLALSDLSWSSHWVSSIWLACTYCGFFPPGDWTLILIQFWSRLKISVLKQYHGRGCCLRPRHLDRYFTSLKEMTTEMDIGML